MTAPTQLTTQGRRWRSYLAASGLPRLDWRPAHDPASRLYAITELAPAGDAGLTARWPVPRPRLVQGADGACTTLAVAQLVNGRVDAGLLARPRLTLDDVQAAYTLAQTLDQVPGEAYVGTSVLGALKAAQQLGWIDAYRWAFGIEDLAAGLAVGPAVVGVPWYVGLTDQDPDRPWVVSGPRIGGHALAVPAYVERNPVFGSPGFVMLNGHQRSGRDGLSFCPRDVLAGLLADQGEAGFPLWN